MYAIRSYYAILLANQLSGLKYLASRGIICKVNIVVLKGINDHHIEDVVKKVKDRITSYNVCYTKLLRDGCRHCQQ